MANHRGTENTEKGKFMKAKAKPRSYKPFISAPSVSLWFIFKS